MGDFAVIGIGRFGSSVARTLYDLGHNVLAIDKDEERLRAVQDHVTHVVQADSTDAEALRAVGVTNFDAVVVAIGANIQESILTTLLLKELGCRRVIAKAGSETQGRVLEKVGADVVIFPERDMGVRVARQLASPNVIDYFALAPNLRVEEVQVTERLAGRTLGELNLPGRFGVNVLLVRRDQQMLIAPAPDQRLLQGDVLVVVGENTSLSRMERAL
ncbi:MAG: TrkA family potassium uptake protein [Armatimonadota bacterium]|jgi:trk system potassium uptake protein TrkA|nr:TrkA family potassium uptake protein [Armatimonadota bacterium]MDR7449141.1 TrkA family potassium uptake protein [Armatimonadota bacterium]MDR7460024.1 TrkA family potassium uptake protein [Armatimonadota bacterium]MDR7480827.1 TrkA family potassium uptake protein [Armatimonadota bacterium]MDR7489432.1 TrkA family potassium uptake protein [Armatimonadota bacterium]